MKLLNRGAIQEPRQGTAQNPPIESMSYEAGPKWVADTTVAWTLCGCRLTTAVVTEASKRRSDVLPEREPACRNF